MGNVEACVIDALNASVTPHLIRRFEKPSPGLHKSGWSGPGDLILPVLHDCSAVIRHPQHAPFSALCTCCLLALDCLLPDGALTPFRFVSAPGSLLREAFFDRLIEIAFPPHYCMLWLLTLLFSKSSSLPGCLPSISIFCSPYWRVSSRRAGTLGSVLCSQDPEQ